MRTITSNPFNGFFSAGQMLGGQGRVRQDAQAMEEERLARNAQIEAAIMSAGAQRKKLEADTAKTEVETDGMRSGFDFFKNAQNAAPVIAARANLDPKQARQYVASLTGHGGPMVAPELDPIARALAGETFASHWNAQGAGKASDLSDVAKFTEGSMRSGQAMAAPLQAKDDPITAAFRLAVGNDQKSTPKLYDNVGNVGKINTLTGDLTIDPTLVEKQAQARMPWDWMLGPGGVPMPRPGGAAELSIQERKDRQGQAALDRSDRQQAQKAAALERKVTRFSADLEKTNVPSFEATLGQVEGLLSKYKDGKIPGFGMGVGGFPDWMVSEEGRELRQAVQALSNIVIKDRSGAAVTNQEMQRFLREIGSGTLRDDAQLIRGVTNLRKSFDAVKRNAVAGVDNETLDEYMNRGGMKLERGAQASGAQPSAAQPGARPAPKPGEIMNGYRFKGGNPNDQNNWERAS